MISKLNYTKRSTLNNLLFAIKGKSEASLNAWFWFSLKPKVDDSKYTECRKVIQDYYEGLYDVWDAGTKVAHTLGYNVIQEDTLNGQV